MTSADIGESLVGAYFRHIVGCDVVVYNTFLRDQQGEIDVVALSAEGPRRVWLCEATTHIHTMSRKSADRMTAKLMRARQFAATAFPDEEKIFQVWSPRVSEGALTRRFGRLQASWRRQGHHLEFIINEDYTARVRALVEHARGHRGATADPAYRMLQVLARLRGESLGL